MFREFLLFAAQSTQVDNLLHLGRCRSLTKIACSFAIAFAKFFMAAHAVDQIVRRINICKRRGQSPPLQHIALHDFNGALPRATGQALYTATHKDAHSVSGI